MKTKHPPSKPGQHSPSKIKPAENAKLRPGRKPLTAQKACEEIAEIIDTVDNRCLAADGPVTPTNEEIRLPEIQKIYRLARRGQIAP